MLSRRASAEHSPWCTSRTLYLKEIMDALSPSSPIEHVVFMKCSQIEGQTAGITGSDMWCTKRHGR